MAARRIATEGDPSGIDPESRGIRLDPADAIIDVGEAARIGGGALAEIERDNDAAGMPGILADAVAGFEITAQPAAAMQVDEAGKRPAVVNRHEHPRGKLAVAVAQITQVFDERRSGPRPRQKRV